MSQAQAVVRPDPIGKLNFCRVGVTYNTKTKCVHDGRDSKQNMSNLQNIYLKGVCLEDYPVLIFVAIINFATLHTLDIDFLLLFGCLRKGHAVLLPCAFV